MRRLSFLVLVGSLLASSLSSAESLDLDSPNGAVRFRVITSSEGHLLYSVLMNGRVYLEPARAGVMVDGSDIGLGITVGSPQTRALFEVYPWRGNKTQATNSCRASEIPLRSGAGSDWILEVRVFDDGAAFRYRVPGIGTRRVAGESTAWRLPRQTTVWYQTDTTNYEGVYQSSRADEVPLESTVREKKQATHLGLPLTAVYPDGTFGLVNEACLYGYSGLTLRPEGDGGFTAAFEDDSNGWNMEGPILSPWRIVILSKDLNGVVNSDLISSLAPPPDPKIFPAGLHTPWVQPGKAPCTWMVFGNDGAQWHRQKWFVDLTAAIGCEYLLVDAGWRTEKWGWLKEGGDLWARTAELCRYAAERNVGIILWHGYPEGRDDGPALTTPAAREELFRNCQQAGVKGVKIDFFDSESKAVIDAYEDLLRRSAKYQLMINFHGANKPTGEARTWPHEIAREGIREQEYVLWDSLPLSHYGALPFTRMAAGHADFLPGYVQSRFLKNTTAIFQMASTIVFSAPFLCWPDNPEAYLDSPLLQFVRTVPVTWDETRILPGSVIGESVLIARRKDADWYVAGLNCRSEPRTLEVDLSDLHSLDNKSVTLYRDGANKTAFHIEHGFQPATDSKLSVRTLAGGGFIAHLTAAKQHSGWR